MNLGIITYTSLHCNFTNYGTVLQAWALQKSIKSILSSKELSKTKSAIGITLVNYCPDSMIRMNPLAPFENMWDLDNDSREQARLTFPSIKANLEKIEKFYDTQFNLTKNVYNGKNFNEIKDIEQIDKFIVGSDSIWDIDEFGVDDVFFANKDVMRGCSIAYAPSFQDSIEKFNQVDWLRALSMIRNNFVAVALRDKKATSLIEVETGINYPVVIDPTLILKATDYSEIESTNDSPQNEPYLLYYSRRYNPEAEKNVERIATERGLKIVEISLRAQNASKHIMRYDAGVEEFLSLIKNATVVITNSFHCMIFAILYHRDFYVYSRQHCYGKIVELLKTLELSDRFIPSGKVYERRPDILYNCVEDKLNKLRLEAKTYLNRALKKLL